MAWLAKLPYDVIMVQEHHRAHNRQLDTSFIAKKFSMVFSPASTTVIDKHGKTIQQEGWL
eukprot:5343797-Karenia_brevis.AAC.1